MGETIKAKHAVVHNASAATVQGVVKGALPPAIVSRDDSAMPHTGQKPRSDRGGARAPVSVQRLDRFIETLAETSNASEAARQSGLPLSTAKKYRRTDADFATRWQQALADGVADLRMRAIEQARFGAITTESVTVNGAGRMTTTIRQCAVQSLREIERMLELLSVNTDTSDVQGRVVYDAKVERLTVEAITHVIEKLVKEQRTKKARG